VAEHQGRPHSNNLQKEKPEYIDVLKGSAPTGQPVVIKRSHTEKNQRIKERRKGYGKIIGYAIGFRFAPQAFLIRIGILNHCPLPEKGKDHTEYYSK
jgi:hypothetical protein